MQSVAPISHQRRARRRGSLIALLIVGIVAVGIAVVELTLNRGVEAEPVATPPAVVATPTPSHEPVEEPEPIHAATPLELHIPSLSVHAEIEVFTDAMVAAGDGWIDPTTADIVSWWQGGGTPSFPAENTVYLYGHVSRLPAVFNDLHTVEPGALITVMTEAGSIDYDVEKVLEPILMTALPDDPRVNAAVPGRLVLIGCYREEDQGRRPTTHNLVVIAQQVGV
ncbi:class F sortase [Xylanimonas ulmi]|uniref:Sortase family protein n=1 Tax=Xylanimonas ulmi TaxID=228973 RepID=A0A4Q7M2B3_9MICO|nr:class F sortase [Xylanibacterium ulmi]RZS62016.1 sortase family protein [Xylanibacterium ulmi]